MGVHMAIQVYQGATLTLERAESIAPHAFLDAYTWFYKHAGERGPRPYGSSAPKDISIKLAAQRGIHKPSNAEYALSVTSTANSFYSQDRIHELDDGTWVMSYSEQRKNEGSTSTSTQYNEALHKCLRDGLPVGVFLKKTSSDYLCLGLAFVEHYDTIAQTFLLHGPVCLETPLASLSPIITESVAKPEIERVMIEFDGGINKSNAEEIERALKTGRLNEEQEGLIPLIQATRQHQYRREVLDTYQNRCAVTGCSESNALQVTRIVSYLGMASNRPSNGLCLRADIRQLFDRHLISIDPHNLTVHVSSNLMKSEYGDLEGRTILYPHTTKHRPSQQRLAAHFAEYRERTAVQAKRALEPN